MAPVDQIRRPGGSRVGDGRARRLAAANPLQAGLTHQSLDGAAGHGDAFPGQLGVNLAGTVEPSAGPQVHPADLHRQLRVARSPPRRRPPLRRPIGARGDLAAMLEHPADRLDPEHPTVGVDEGNYHGSRGSSSRAKKLDAASRIWLARLSSFKSRSRSLIRFASLVVVPDRCPVSIRCYSTQPRNVSGTTPTRSPMRRTAWFNVSDGSSAIASATRIDRSRSSCGYSSVLAQPRLLVRSDHASNPGRFRRRPRLFSWRSWLNFTGVRP
jgi:hypothetical protein